MADSIPTTPNSPRLAAMPEAGHDPGDPLNPDIEEENNTPEPPIGDPGMDMEVTGENEVDRDEDAMSDLGSDLSELDDRQFDDFDPTAVAIEERPAIAVDESNVAALGKHKRKRAEGEEEVRKEKREKRREKTKKPRRRRGEDDDDDPMPDGVQLEGKRRRAGKGEGRERPSRAAAARADEEDESLTPEERRKRALDRAMDDALRGGKMRKRKQDGIDLDAMADAEIEDMRRKMTDAAMADTQAREQNLPAMHKLKLLPSVVALLNRKNLAQSIVDPDINLLEAIRFFLEPLSDGSLPAYNIQRELFAALGRLPINKDSLIASGIGKVVYFYTKSKRPELTIKRQAERLLTEWMRPILKRTDDYRQREVLAADYDPNAMPIRSTQTQERDAATIAREKALANPQTSRYVLAGKRNVAYTVAPRSDPNAIRPSVRAPGAGGAEAFRKLKLRREGKTAKS